MNSKVSIIMYHYVRDLLHSRYPSIKGLDISLFKEQLEYLNHYYTFVKMEQVIEAVVGGVQLPPKAVLLTFDDGYIDHYTQVFPILDSYGIQGSFFPPVRAITEFKVLDVNKIHYLLASTADVNVLVKAIYQQLDKYRLEYNLESNNFYYKKLAEGNRFDPPQVVFIKRLFQRELSDPIKSLMLNELMETFVGVPEEILSRELYMNIDQLMTMNRHGMYIGVHGYNHLWLSKLNLKNKIEEIEKSIEFLATIKSDINKWVICYPYGDYDKEIIELIKSRNCAIALTTEVAVAELQPSNQYNLPRLDTNDLPKDRNSKPNTFYKYA